MPATLRLVRETAVSPESSEGRERIVRLEGQIADVRDDVSRNERTFGPLPLAVERLQWTIDAINVRLDKRDREDNERFEKMARSFENQITACSSQVAQVARAQEEWQRAEQKRREDLAATAIERKSSDKTSRRAMWGLIGAAAVTGFLGLLAQIITALT